MYEDMTFEKIMKQALDRVPNTFDKRQGAVIYDAVAPMAAELAQMYAECNRILELGFASTSSGKYLERKALELGVERKPAIKAERLGIFKDSEGEPFDVPLESRFFVDEIYYQVDKKLADGEFLLICDLAGDVGNIPEGAMTAVPTIPGLAAAELTDILSPGVDEETDESLYRRYKIRAQLPSTSGNKYHYKQWALEVAGVGDAKVFPRWDGPGTVKVVVADQLLRPAIPELVNKVWEHIEDVRPVGPKVTVVPATSKLITIMVDLVLAGGYDASEIKMQFEANLISHFAAVAFEESYVSYAKVGAILLAIPGVLDHLNLFINGSKSAITLGDEDVPVLSEVIFNVLD